jgi:thiol-disulfide isomerase/thioredoxin
LNLSCLGSATTVDTQDLRGPAVVNLWASWCEPCQQEMPLLQRAAARHGSAVQVIGVNTNDSVTPALAFLRRTGATYPQLSDPTGKLAIALRSPGLPVTVAVDSAGRVVWRKVGIMVADDVAAAVRAATAGGGARASTNARRG